MPKPIELRIRVDDEGVQVLKETGRELDSVEQKAKKSTNAMGRGFKRMQEQLERLKKAVFSLKGALAGLGLALTVAGIVKLGQALIAPSRQVETMTASFKVLTGSLGIAKARLAELTEFARTTPFTLPQVFQAARIMRVFGIDTTKNMRLLGDAASAAQVPIEELAVWVGRLATGSTGGEVFQRLEELGVATRTQLEMRGLKFDKQKTFQGTAKQALDALGRHFQETYGGMMLEQSKTMDGMISNFEDFVYQARLKLGGPLFQVVKGALAKILEQGDMLSSSGKLEEWGEKIAAAAGNSLVWLGRVVDFFRNDLIPAISDFWSNLTSTSLDSVGEKMGKSVAEGFMDGFSAAISNAGDWLNDALWGGKDAGPIAWLDRQFGGQRSTDRNPAMQGPRLADGSFVAAGVRDGVDKSDLASAMRELADSAKGAGGGNAPAGADTAAGQRDLIARGRAGSRFRLSGVPEDPLAFGPGGPSGPGGIGGDFLGQFGRGLEDNTEFLRQAVEENRSLYQQMVIDAVDNLGAVQQAWLDFKFGTLDIMGGFFEDLADESMTGSERWKAILEGMQRMALRTIWDLASGWIKARIMQATGEKIVQGALAATAATTAATAATETAAATTVTSAKASEATAKAAAAYGWWPIVGAALLGAFVALLVGSLAKFESGGVVGGGSGTKDDVPAMLTSGEGVVNRRGMASLGAGGLAMLNAGGGIGGGDMFSITVDARGSDAAAVERVVEEKLVPALEDLYERRRLNVSGSRLRRA